MLWSAHKVMITDDVFCPHPRTVESIEVICFHLLQIMVFTELSPATLFNFSKTACQFYLSNKQRTLSDRKWYGCLEEYIRLREVITWCVISAADTEPAIENLDRTCLPEPEIALRFLQECVESSPAEPRSKSIVDFSKDRESFVENVLKEDLDKFLGMVDLVSIHPELLLTVIEPLNLIDLSRIYSVQSMRGNGMCQVTDVWQWAGCGLYSLRTRFSNNMTFTVSVKSRRVGKFSLFSVAELKMEFSRRTFQWEIVVIPHGGFEHRLRMDLLEIGFYRLRRGESLGMRMGKHWMKMDKYRCSSLSESSRGSVLSISKREEKFCDKKSSTESSGFVPRDGSPHDLWDSPIRVIVNRDEGSYSFSSDVEYLTFSIDNAEDVIFYPAIYIFSYVDSVCRPHYERLTVRIQNMKGFDQPE